MYSMPSRELQRINKDGETRKGRKCWSPIVGLENQYPDSANTLIKITFCGLDFKHMNWFRICSASRDFVHCIHYRHLQSQLFSVSYLDALQHAAEPFSYEVFFDLSLAICPRCPPLTHRWTYCSCSTLFLYQRVWKAKVRTGRSEADLKWYRWSTKDETSYVFRAYRAVIAEINTVRSDTAGGHCTVYILPNPRNSFHHTSTNIPTGKLSLRHSATLLLPLSTQKRKGSSCSSYVVEF